ncbi:MAG: RNA pyrophosphohydrolase [Steroidobacteraceae bacterium]
MSDQDYIDEQGYRANVGIVLIHEDGKVFLGGRAGARGWQFPQGGILHGERPETALYRELHEEIGLREEDVECLGATRGWLRYRLPARFRRQGAVRPCVGQKQKWFLLRLRGPESSLRFDATSHPAEFDRWRWADYWEPVREVIYFKRHVYARALQELGDYAFPGGLPDFPEWWQSTVPRRRARD